MSSAIPIDRRLYGPDVTVEEKTTYAAHTRTDYEEDAKRFPGSSWQRDSSYDKAWWWRTRAPASRIGDLHTQHPEGIVHIGWADPVLGQATCLDPPDDRRCEEVMVAVARRFDAWQGKPPITGRIGLPLAIDDALVTILTSIANGGRFGYDVPWAKGKLTVIPRSFADEILRCDVTASVDHEARDRPAHHELKGTLDLWVPRGWPKRFVADGQWNYPSFVLAGRTIHQGTFHVEMDWSYGTDVPPAPAAPSP